MRLCKLVTTSRFSGMGLATIHSVFCVCMLVVCIVHMDAGFMLAVPTKTYSNRGGGGGALYSAPIVNTNGNQGNIVCFGIPID